MAKPRPTSSASLKKQTTVVVLGPGQMGLVCAGLLAADQAAPGRKTKGSKAAAVPTTRNIRVILWGHDREELAVLTQTRKSKRLEGFVLPKEVELVTDDAQALRNADVIVSAIPVQHMREAWTRLAKHVPPHACVVSVAKGIEMKTLLRPTQIIADVLRKTGVDDPDKKPRSLAVLSGPTIAAELARFLPATMIVASDDPEFAARLQKLFTTRWMRIYTHNDVLGVEIAGACKNVIAIAAGVVDGLKAGNNAKSALLARGLAEIVRLGVYMGASPDTFFGIAGIGDLATSCFSPEGRNRSCGEALGRGMKLEAFLAKSGSTVEGVWTTKAVLKLARKYKVEMPITEAVRRTLFHDHDPIDGIAGLMAREMKSERVG